jgi:hypothetical protein
MHIVKGCFHGWIPCHSESLVLVVPDTGLGLAQTLLVQELFALQVILDRKTLKIGSRSFEAILSSYHVDSVIVCPWTIDTEDMSTYLNRV